MASSEENEMYSKKQWEGCMEIAVQTARTAGQVIREAFKHEKEVSTKSSPVDLVTETDRLVEDLIISSLREKYPSHRFIGEESSAAGEKCLLTDSPTWIIDPIDGTCNFIHSFPMVAVSIGFAVNKELEFGVIYHCLDENLYTARKGHGAFCNGIQLQVSKETADAFTHGDLQRLGCVNYASAAESLTITSHLKDGAQEDMSKALILTEIGAKRDPATLKIFSGNMERLLKAQVHGIRVIGSATLALCQVASGAADAYYQFGLHCWDIAAAAVIIREAGGNVIDTSGGPLDLMSRRIVAAGTVEMAHYIAQEIQTITYERDDHNAN
ncbi:inositol monophosphatase 2 isoform X1 [Acipenser ruthenus]|uniref:inositol monophosphatase 2 isoform X1 n=1 Tax=Acipenser ruthenus TaxID=7906 RepID=UPI002740727E|nr:inositol monophosphatase 2 isoform X1 [Acipenser ruthenus]